MSQKLFIKLVGFGLLVGGIYLCWMGMQRSNSIGSRVYKLFNQDLPPSVYKYLIVGLVISVIGIVMLLMKQK